MASGGLALGVGDEAREAGLLLGLGLALGTALTAGQEALHFTLRLLGRS